MVICHYCERWLGSMNAMCESEPVGVDRACSIREETWVARGKVMWRVVASNQSVSGLNSMTCPPVVFYPHGSDDSEAPASALEEVSENAAARAGKFLRREKLQLAPILALAP